VQPAGRGFGGDEVVCYNRGKLWEMGAKVNSSGRRWFLVASVVLVIVGSCPYVVAWAIAPSDAHFTGLLFNPLDGNSYIAKMRQGYDGSWQFRLPYTSEHQDGAPIFLFYLLLGHVARWLHLPLLLVYHLVRIVSGLLMVGAICAFVRQYSTEAFERRVMAYMAVLGSGFGWLVAFLGLMTADLWVAEAFPFYAWMVNPHFPLSMALMVVLGLYGIRVIEQTAEGSAFQPAGRYVAGMAVTAVLLGVVQPFGLVGSFGGLGLALVANAMRRERVPWRAGAWIAAVAVLAAIYPLYMQWTILRDPVLAAWNAQNVTESPAIWDWVLSYGIVFALALLGIWRAVRNRTNTDWFILGWLAVTLVGLFAPLQLQRRLSLGLSIPLGLLAGRGWWRAARPRLAGRRWRVVRGAVLAACVLTSVFLILGAVVSAAAGDGRFYLTVAEWQALGWLRECGDRKVVLCAPATGIFVPAWGGQPVVYGHPFETVDAQRRLGEVSAFWGGAMTQDEQAAFMRDRRVGYVLVGPRERALGNWHPGEVTSLKVVFESSGVYVYEYVR